MIHFWLNLVGKTWSINTITPSSSSTRDDRLVADLMIYPIGSASFQDVFADQLLPQMEMLGGAIVTDDSTNSGSRAIIEDM